MFEAIAVLGGLRTCSVLTRTTSCVVIGVFASRDWINTSHGQKIEKAAQLREKGTGTNIVSEKHCWQFVHGHNLPPAEPGVGVSMS